MKCYEITFYLPKQKRNWEKIAICAALWLASVYFMSHIIIAAIR
jgi:hypothetical protein